MGTAAYSQGKVGSSKAHDVESRSCTAASGFTISGKYPHPLCILCMGVNPLSIMLWNNSRDCRRLSISCLYLMSSLCGCMKSSRRAQMENQSEQRTFYSRAFNYRDNHSTHPVFQKRQICSFFIFLGNKTKEKIHTFLIFPVSVYKTKNKLQSVFLFFQFQFEI